MGSGGKLMGTLAQLPEDLKFTVGELITAERLNEIAEYYNGTTYYDSGNVEMDSITLYMRVYETDTDIAEFYGVCSRILNPYPWMRIYVTQWAYDPDEGKYVWYSVVDEGYGLNPIYWNPTIILPANREGWFTIGFDVSKEQESYLNLVTWMKILYAGFPIDNVRGDYLVYMDDIDSSGNRTSTGQMLTVEMLNTGRCMTIPYI